MTHPKSLMKMYKKIMNQYTSKIGINIKHPRDIREADSFHFETVLMIRGNYHKKGVSPLRKQKNWKGNEGH